MEYIACEIRVIFFHFLLEWINYLEYGYQFLLLEGFSFVSSNKIIISISSDLNTIISDIDWFKLENKEFLEMIFE